MRGTLGRLLAFSLTLVFAACTSDPAIVGLSKIHQDFADIKSKYKTVGLDGGATKLGDLPSDQREKIDNDLNTAMQGCASHLKDMEDESQGQIEGTNAWIIVGGIAGLVVAPALLVFNASANAGYAALASGLSGFTTFYVKDRDSSNQSGAAIAKEHDAIIDALKTEFTNVTDGSATLDQAEAAIVRINADCQLYHTGIPVFSTAPATNDSNKPAKPATASTAANAASAAAPPQATPPR